MCVKQGTSRIFNVKILEVDKNLIFYAYLCLYFVTILLSYKQRKKSVAEHSQKLH